MGEKTKENGSAVKIDSSLLADVEKFIEKSENKFKFANKKQFVDLAVHEFLEELKNGKKRENGR